MLDLNMSKRDRARLNLALKRIVASKAKIARERDTLRDLIDEIEEIIGDADDAVTAIEGAVDTISKYL